MLKQLLIGFLFSLVLSFVLGLIFIPILKKFRARQTILCYVKEHFCKSGTPTMAGVFFIISSVISFFLVKSPKSEISTLCVLITLAFMLVGFLDDFIKVKYCKNEGLKPAQKIIFQLAISLIACYFAKKMGLTKVFIPFTKKIVDIGFWFYPLVVLAFLGATNCVNLTDGLDGLAGSVSFVGLLFSAILIILQTEQMHSNYIVDEEYINLSIFAICLCGALVGFLCFNTNKASVFMGDTGSLGLGGAFCSILLFSGNIFYIAIIGIMFVVTGISVILQVIYYKRTKKRLFLMAPLHHHFQHKGYSECKIVYAYKTVTLLFGLLSIIPFC